MKRKPFFSTPFFIGVVLLFLLAACQPGRSAAVEPTTTAASTLEALAATATFAPTRLANMLPTSTPAMPGGELVFTDKFDDGGMWKNVTSTSGDIIASGEKLTLAVKSKKGLLTQLRKEWLPADYYLEVTAEARLCRGEDAFGILFRAPAEQSGYRLLVNCNGQISVQQVVGGTPTTLVDWTQSGVLTPGLPFPVDIGILVRGKSIRVYLDKVLQLELNRDLFREGSMGFYARAAADTPLTVNFYDLNVYQPLPEEMLLPGTGTPTGLTATP